jgi:hypothetical protein
MSPPYTRRQVALATIALAGCASPQNDVSDASGSPDSATIPTEASAAGSTATPSTPRHIGGENYVFVTEAELQRQQSRVDAGREPWKTAYDQLVEAADRALEMDLQSVTGDDGSHAFDMGDGTDYRDYHVAIPMSNGARDCGLAYWFTGEDRYAERVVEILHHWTLAPETYMRPTLNETGYPLSIEQHITIPAFCYGASFVRGHEAWDDYEPTMAWKGERADSTEAAFATWVDTRLRTFTQVRHSSAIRNRCGYNNVWAWRIADRAATAAYLGKDPALELAKDMYRAEAETICADGTEILRPWADFRNSDAAHAYNGDPNPAENGYFTRELDRTEAFHYTQYNLKALASALTVIQRYDGTDLWEFNAPQDQYDGSSLWKAFNWLEEYVRNSGAWAWNAPWKPISASNVEAAATTYELAYAQWGDFYDVLVDSEKIDGRPYRDGKLLGPVTLTHGAPEPHDGYTVTEPTHTPDTPTTIPGIEGLAVTRATKPGSGGPQQLNVEGALSRDDGTTVYEVLIPWAELPIDAETETFGLSLLVNDSDGEGRLGYVEWGSGIGQVNDPSQFKRATIGSGDEETYGIERSGQSVDGSIDSAAMDGQAIDLADGTVIEMDGTPTVSGQLWFTYDDAGLQLSALIEDETHYQEAAPPKMWKGDSIQFGLTARPPSEASSYELINVGGNPVE